MGGCCCHGNSSEPKTVRWEVADELPDDNKFVNSEWIPKVVSRKPRHARSYSTFVVKIIDDEQECFISGVTFLPNGDIFVVDQANKKLKLFDKKTFKFKMSVQVPSVPLCVCSVPNNPNAFVTFPSSCRIRQVGVTDNDIQRVDTIQTVSRCTAIASNKYGGLAVAVNMVGNQWQIQLMNAKGKIQKRVHGETLFLNPEHIAITADMNLVICDRGNHTVYHITPDGYVIFAYKELKVPMDVFVDKKGYIFIAGPERIHQLNERGERVQYILSKVEIGFAPVSMAYREKDELLLVGGKSDKIKVYSLE